MPRRLALITVCGLALLAVCGVWMVAGQSTQGLTTVQGLAESETPAPTPTLTNEEWADILFDPVYTEAEAIQRAIDEYGREGNPRNGVARLMREKVATTWLRASQNEAAMPGYLLSPDLWSRYGGEEPAGAGDPAWLVGIQVDPVTQRAFMLQSIVPLDDEGSQNASSSSGSSLASNSDRTAIHTEVAYIIHAGTGSVTNATRLARIRKPIQITVAFRPWRSFNQRILRLSSQLRCLQTVILQLPKSVSRVHHPLVFLNCRHLQLSSLAKQSFAIPGASHEMRG